MSKKIELFKKLGNFNSKTNSTNIVNIDDFIGDYDCLRLGNGGSWCRKSAIRAYKLVSMKGNGVFYYTWDASDDEKKEIEDNFNKFSEEKKFYKTGGNAIKFIQIYGLLDDENINKSRPIRKEIKDYYKKLLSCVVCGTTKTVCDHKNDLYNDVRVLNIKTQSIDDFQPLCNHCNLQKRQVCKTEYQNNKIYSAKNIQRYKNYPFEFPWEKKAFDINDTNCKNETFWYDPVDFDKKIYYYSIYVLPVINELKYKIKIKQLKFIH